MLCFWCLHNSGSFDRSYFICLLLCCWWSFMLCVVVLYYNDELDGDWECRVPANKIDDFTHLVLTNHPKKTRFVSFRRSCELSTLIQKHDNPSELSDLLFIGQMCSLLHYRRLMRAIKSIFDFHAIKLKAWKRPELAHFLQRKSTAHSVSESLDRFHKLFDDVAGPSSLITNNKIIQKFCWAQTFPLSLHQQWPGLCAKCEMLHQTISDFSRVSHFGRNFFLSVHSSSTISQVAHVEAGWWELPRILSSFLLLIDQAHTRALRQKKLINFNLLSQCDFPTHKFEL